MRDENYVTESQDGVAGPDGSVGELASKLPSIIQFRNSLSCQNTKRGGYGVDTRCLVVTITTMNSRQIIKQLERDGWYLARVKGSHHQFKHDTKKGLVTVKHPDSDIPAGTLNSIRKQACWK
ncbi:MAG: type II toxin-antitoxin system HicA family toxin [Burkholderiaceae bacterium]